MEPSSCVTPAGASTSLTSRINGMTKHTHTHTHTRHTYTPCVNILITPWEDQCEWHRMTRMTRPDCAVMCNLVNTHTHTRHTYTPCVNILIYSVCVICVYMCNMCIHLHRSQRCFVVVVFVFALRFMGSSPSLICMIFVEAVSTHLRAPGGAPNFVFGVAPVT